MYIKSAKYIEESYHWIFCLCPSRSWNHAREEFLYWFMRKYANFSYLTSLLLQLFFCFSELKTFALSVDLAPSDVTERSHVSSPANTAFSTPTHTSFTEGTPSYTASSPSCCSDMLGNCNHNFKRLSMTDRFLFSLDRCLSPELSYNMFHYNTNLI